MRHIPRLVPAVLLLTAGLVSACGGADRAGAPSPEAPGLSSAGGGDLLVVHDPGDGSEPVTWTLTCDPVGGTHPDPAGACADLQAADAPFADPDPDAICTEVFGGPQTARVTGSWYGQAVDTVFDRANGCGIARWDAVGRLLPEAPGTALSPPA